MYILKYQDKFSRLNVFHVKCTRKKFDYKFFSKSRSFKAQFINSRFNHVNFKGSIMTKCTFKQSRFVGVEFIGTNLKGSSFNKAYFEDVVFVGANLTNTNFKGAKFKNTIFINTNIDCICNRSGIRVMDKYPMIDISDELMQAIEYSKKNDFILKYKILHLGDKKANNLNIYLLLETFEEKDLINGIYYATDNINLAICTLSCLRNFLLKNKNKYVKLK